MTDPSFLLVTETTLPSEIDAFSGRSSDVEANFAGPVSHEVLETFERLILRRFPETRVRFYGFCGYTCDLKLLECIPSVTNLTLNCLKGEIVNFEALGALKELRSFSLAIERLNSFAFLRELAQSLETLSLEETKKRNLDLAGLAHFSKLRALTLVGHKRGIETLSELNALQELRLASVSVDSLEFLAPLHSLESLRLTLGGTTNFAALSQLAKLRDFSFIQVEGLKNIEMLQKLKSLEALELEALPNVSSLPSFSHLECLRAVYLHNLKGLLNFEPLARAPNLRIVKLTGAAHCDAETLRLFVGHPTLRTIAIGLGSFKKNRAARNLFRDTAISVGPESAFGGK